MNVTAPQNSPGHLVASGFTPDDLTVVDAWAQVAPTVECFHFGNFENGRACVLVAVNGVDCPDLTPAWLVWPEAGEIVVKAVGLQPKRSSHPTLRAALQVICPISATQWRSADLIADAMLVYRHGALDPSEQHVQGLSLAA